jgi:pyrroloquinoline quinone (PQQ) biosynthesis protein C
MTKWASKYAEKYADQHIQKSDKGIGYFYCRACDAHYKFTKIGEKAISAHISKEKHKSNSRAINKNAPMTAFIKHRTVNCLKS